MAICLVVGYTRCNIVYIVSFLSAYCIVQISFSGFNNCLFSNLRIRQTYFTYVIHWFYCLGQHEFLGGLMYDVRRKSSRSRFYSLTRRYYFNKTMAWNEIKNYIVYFTVFVDMMLSITNILLTNNSKTTLLIYLYFFIVSWQQSKISKLILCGSFNSQLPPLCQLLNNAPFVWHWWHHTMTVA